MQPITPVVIELKHLESTYGGPGANQPEYVPLPAIRTVHGYMTRWTFTDEERKAIAEGGDVLIQTFAPHGRGPTPVRALVATKEVVAEWVDLVNKGQA